MNKQKQQQKNPKPNNNKIQFLLGLKFSKEIVEDK